MLSGTFNTWNDKITKIGKTKNKTTKDENGENVPHLEISDVVLIHFNIVINDYYYDSRVLYTFAPIL